MRRSSRKLSNTGVSIQQPQSPPTQTQQHQQQQQQPGVKDPNTIALDKVYDSVQSAHGDGKFGARNDITPEEASQLADQLIEMRTVLMEELDAGIPGSGSEPSTRNKKQESAESSSSAPSPSSSVSKYQQMLAKAKAQKAAGK
mmetsp:Transcript_7875/g.19660  ORF Transcript_7875/g.19660 Transcript_7875/m.19660 type:complete len:143 (-) Transcript_7875:58-486(-)